MWKSFCDAVGAKALFGDERDDSVRQRRAAKAELNAEVEKAIADLPVEEVVAKLNAAGVPCGPIGDIQGGFENPQAKHLKMTKFVVHSELGDVKPRSMMRHKLRRALLALKKTCLVTGLAAIAASLCSCESREGRDPQLEAEVVESLRTAIRKQGDGSQFDFAEVAAFDWDMAYVFTPYTSKGTVNEALGSRIDSRGIDNQDAFNLLVFTRSGRVVLTVKVPRGICDLQHPDQPYRSFRVANGSARFQVAIDETGWCRARSVDGMLD